MSKDLKKRGFNFVGSTICYAFMQAVGMVNDHSVECFRYAQVNRARRPDLHCALLSSIATASERMGHTARFLSPTPASRLGTATEVQPLTSS